MRWLVGLLVWSWYVRPSSSTNVGAGVCDIGGGSRWKGGGDCGWTKERGGGVGELAIVLPPNDWLIVPAAPS